MPEQHVLVDGETVHPYGLSLPHVLAQTCLSDLAHVLGAISQVSDPKTRGMAASVVR
jgi:hypothetical protein